MSPLPVPGANAGVSELLQAGTRLFRITLPKCLPIAMVAALFSRLQSTARSAGATAEDFRPSD